MRPLAMRPATVPPAISTCAMIQPPKMSPFWLASAGIGTTRSAGSLSAGRRSTSARPVLDQLHHLVADQAALPVPRLVPEHHVALHLRGVPRRVLEADRLADGARQVRAGDVDAPRPEPARGHGGLAIA